MAECIHELDEESCGVCSDGARRSRQAAYDGSMAGKSFALVYAPSVRGDTFLHLNREGDHWKIRWYSSPSAPARELAQSGSATTRLAINLADVVLVHEIAYPYSTRPGGVSVRNSRYWFDEIEKTNAAYGVGHPSGSRSADSVD